MKTKYNDFTIEFDPSVDKQFVYVDDVKFFISDSAAFKKYVDENTDYVKGIIDFLKNPPYYVKDSLADVEFFFDDIPQMYRGDYKYQYDCDGFCLRSKGVLSTSIQNSLKELCKVHSKDMCCLFDPDDEFGWVLDCCACDFINKEGVSEWS